MMSNPEMMQQMMDSPMVQSMLKDPAMLQEMLGANPQAKAALDSNPMLSQMMSNPDLMRASMEAMKDPAMQNLMGQGMPDLMQTLNTPSPIQPMSPPTQTSVTSEEQALLDLLSNLPT